MTSYVIHRWVIVLLYIFVCAHENCAQTFTQYYFKNTTIGVQLAADNSHDVALDSQNNSYVVGSTRGSLFAPSVPGYNGQNQFDLFVAKFNSDMSLLWGKQIGSNTSDEAYGVCLSADQSTLYVCGLLDGYAWLAKLDASDGRVLQNYSFPEPRRNGFDPKCADVTLCGDSICIAGIYFSNSSYYNDGFVVKLNANLTVEWDRRFQYPKDDCMNVVKYSQALGRLFAAGYTSDYSVGNEFYLVELDINTGSILYSHSWPNTTCAEGRFNEIIDMEVSNDALYYIGNSEQEFSSATNTTQVCAFGYYALAIGKLNLSNLSSHIWFYNVSYLPNYSVDGKAMDLGADNLLYIVGGSTSGSFLGKNNTYPPGFYYDWFLLVMNSDGQLVNVTFQGEAAGDTNDIANAIQVNTAYGRMILAYDTGGSDISTDVVASAISNLPFPSLPSVSTTPSPASSIAPSTSPTSSNSPEPEKQKKKSSNAVPIIIGVVLGALFIGLLAAVAVLYINRKKRQRKTNLEMSERPANISLLLRQDSLTTMERRWNIEKSELEIGQQIGQGAFGVVYKARWRNCDCVVKQLNPENYAQQQVDEFLKEASTVQNLRNHKNVCTVFGICPDPISIVMEYVSGGSLRDLVYQEDFELTTKMLISFAKDIAGGMSHLHRENLLHCDLACRNLLFEKTGSGEYLVKVADFGLTRTSEISIYVASSSAKFPIRWSAPELLSRREVSRACDIWSYGVVLWEIIEGKFPYYEIDSNEMVIMNVCDKKQTLPPPTRFPTPQEVLQIMNQCWSYNPSSRPSFDDIFHSLEELERQLFGVQATKQPMQQDVQIYGNNTSNNSQYRVYSDLHEPEKVSQSDNTPQNENLYGNRTE